MSSEKHKLVIELEAQGIYPAAVIERLKRHLGTSVKKEIAEAVGITEQKITHFQKRGTVPWMELLSFCTKRGVSLRWIMTGEVKMDPGEPQKGYEGALAVIEALQHDKKTLTAQLDEAEKERKKLVTEKKMTRGNNNRSGSRDKHQKN